MKVTLRLVVLCVFGLHMASQSMHRLLSVVDLYHEKEHERVRAHDYAAECPATPASSEMRDRCAEARVRASRSSLLLALRDSTRHWMSCGDMHCSEFAVQLAGDAVRQVFGSIGGIVLLAVVFGMLLLRGATSADRFGFLPPPPPPAAAPDKRPPAARSRPRVREITFEGGGGVATDDDLLRKRRRSAGPPLLPT